MKLSSTTKGNRYNLSMKSVDWVAAYTNVITIKDLTAEELIRLAFFCISIVVPAPPAAERNSWYDDWL